MKIRHISILMALILAITSFALAEGNNDTSREFTADEQAYDVYLDLSHVFDYGVRYLDEMDFLWETALELDSVSGAEQGWFKYSILGSTRAGGFTRYMGLSELAKVRYGFESVEDLYSVFESAMARRYEKTDIIWAILAMEVEAHYLEAPDTLKESLGSALSGIRELMRIDREYPFLKDLQDYYKDAVLLHEYIADFNDNRTGFMSKHDEFAKMRTSYSVDFDFIFDSSSEECAYIRNVRAQEETERNRAGFEKAQALEDAGNIEGAISLYWEYYTTETPDRINACRNNQKESLYQHAVALENEGDYESSLAIYQELSSYKDSKERIAAINEKMYGERRRALASQRTIDGSPFCSFGVTNEGKVLAVGNNYYGQCDVSSWRNIIQIASGTTHTVGLKSDGTVVAVGYNDDGRCNVSSWRNIIAIDACGSFTMALKEDGTVVAVGRKDEGQCNVSGWRDIVAIAAGTTHAVGLKSDGTVVATGENGAGQCDVSSWQDIIAVSASQNLTVGLKKDGTVVATGDNSKEQRNISGWDNILAIAAGGEHIVALKVDGTCIAVGANEDGQCKVSDWSDIVEIAAGYDITLGLKSDGTVIVIGNNYNGQCVVGDWKNISTPNH